MFGVAVVIAFAGVGVSYACFVNTPPCNPNPCPVSFNGTGVIWAVSNDDGSTTVINGNVIDPGDTYTTPKQYNAWGTGSAVDPTTLQVPFTTCTRAVKDVGKTTVAVPDQSDINVAIFNAYPFYYPTVYFGIENTQNYAVTVQSISVTPTSSTAYILNTYGITTGETIVPCQTVIGYMGIQFQEKAQQHATYTFTITITLTQVTQQQKPGPCGYWQNWGKCYTQQNVCSWINNIDKSCNWLGGCNTQNFGNYFNPGSGCSAQQNFLDQYLALQLDVCSGLTNTNNCYNVSGDDPGNYLGLKTPTWASLSQIISAINSKYGTGCNSSQYGILQSVCSDIDGAGS
jgi:hypothetical protein